MGKKKLSVQDISNRMVYNVQQSGEDSEIDLLYFAKYPEVLTSIDDEILFNPHIYGSWIIMNTIFVDTTGCYIMKRPCF